MRKKIKNETKEMVANVDWANVAPDNDNNNTMAYLFPTEVPDKNVVVAKAVLTCRLDSHPFLERTLLLHQPVKIGRAVAKVKAAPSNAIFDCKVLSRDHASLSYTNGHFYLQDTKSSNGTFVNNHRLSEGCVASTPYEVCSGDIVQFGVDVLDNSCSVTHGCIVATLRLYLPDGKEAKASQSTIVKSPSHAEDLCVLNNIIQEAVQREQLLEAKLCSLGGVVQGCAGALSQAWQALCSEERLMARVHFLERRLAALQPTQPITELQQAIQDKHQYETYATEALKAAHEEKLKLLNQLSTIQWSVCSSEEECAVLKSQVDRALKDLQDLGVKKSEMDTLLLESRQALQEAKQQLSHYEVQLLSDISLTNNHNSAENGFGVKTAKNNAEKIALMLENLKMDQNTSVSDFFENLYKNADARKLAAMFKLPMNMKELEVKLYGLKTELWELENCNYRTRPAVKSLPQPERAVPFQKEDIVNDNSVQCEPQTIIDTNSDVNKTNSKYSSSENSDPSEMTKYDEQQKQVETTLQENKETDNLNKTVVEDANIFDEEETNKIKMKILREKINEITEQLDTALENGLAFNLVLVQKDLSFAETHIATLTKDLESATSKLKQSVCEVTQLNQIKGQLSTEIYDLKTNFSKKAEECSKLEMLLSQSPVDEREKTDEDETSKYKLEVTQLRNKLEERTQSEARSSAETDKLNTRIEELQKELHDRSLSSDAQLTAQVENLKKQLSEKESELYDLNKQVSVLIDVQVRLEEMVNSKTSELESLTRQCESRGAAEKILVTELEAQSELSTPPREKTRMEKSKSPIVISSSLAAAEFLHANDSNSLSEDPSISIDHQRLVELEEELVVSKQKYAQMSEDYAQLSARLQNVAKDNLVKRPASDMLVYAVPIAAMLIYVLMYQYIS